MRTRHPHRHQTQHRGERPQSVVTDDVCGNGVVKVFGFRLEPCDFGDKRRQQGALGLLAQAPEEFFRERSIERRDPGEKLRDVDEFVD